MADEVIIIPTGPSTILIPDNIDDIEAPGTVDGGVLPGVFVTANPNIVSGGCADPNPCSDWWCLDDGCPPGCTDLSGGCPPECYQSDDGYPSGPPKITECLQIGYSPLNFSVDTPYGIFGSYGCSYYMKSYDDMSNIWSDSFSDCVSARGVFYIKEFDELLVTSRMTTNNPYSMYRIQILRLNAETGELLQTYEMPSDSNWGAAISDTAGVSVGYRNGAIYVSGVFQYQNSYNSMRFGYMQFNFQTGEITKVFGATTGFAQSYHFGVYIVVDEDSDTMFIANGSYATAYGQLFDHRGSIYMHNVTTDEATLIDTGDQMIDQTDHGERQLLGSKMYIFGDHLIAASCFFYNPIHHIANYYDKTNKSDRVIIYNKTTGEKIKTLITPYPSAYEYAANGNGGGFGYSLSSYGNFFMISAIGEKNIPNDFDSDRYGTGAVYLLNKDFDILQRMDSTPKSTVNSLNGYTIGMKADRIVFGGFPSKSGAGVNKVMTCSYSNFGITE